MITKENKKEIWS